MGYILSELFTLLIVIVMAKWIFILRRGLNNRQWFTAQDRRLLKEPICVHGSATVRYFRYSLVFTLTLIFGAIEIAVVAQFGAAILTAALLLTSAAIVRWTLAEA